MAMRSPPSEWIARRTCLSLWNLAHRSSGARRFTSSGQVDPLLREARGVRAGTSVRPMLADDLCQAGAVIVRRGSRSVPAHFGSVGAEESVCRKHVGIALRADLDVREVAGESDLTVRVAPDRVLAIGPPGPDPLPLSVISIVGPRANRLLDAVGLAPGTCWFNEEFAVLVRERPDRYLLVVADVARAWDALLIAGRPL